MPSLSDHVPEGILKIDQCLKIRPGASGSSTMIASAFVPVGGSDQRRDGDVPAPSQLNSTGIDSPSPNAGDEIAITPSAELCGSNGALSGTSPPHAADTSVIRIRADSRTVVRNRVSIRRSGG